MDPSSAENRIISALRRIMRAVDLHSRQLLDEIGLTGPQILVLREAARLERSSAGALARAVRLSRPTVTGILTRLARRGLIVREPDPRDARSQQILVTAAGRDVLSRAPSLLQERFWNRLGKLEEWEQTQILATLQRIASMMDAEEIAAAPVLVSGTVDPGTDRTDAAEPGIPDPAGPAMGAHPPPSTKERRP